MAPSTETQVSHQRRRISLLSQKGCHQPHSEKNSTQADDVRMCY